MWKSDKIGEDFIIKLPNYLKPYIQNGKALCEEMGRGFAEWAAAVHWLVIHRRKPTSSPLTTPRSPPPLNPGMKALEDARGAIRMIGGGCSRPLVRRHKPRAAEVDRGPS